MTNWPPSANPILHGPPAPPTDAPAPQPGAMDPMGNLLTDTPCRNCGYNLRGLNWHARCPECGTPIGLSVHGDLLRFADPGWVGNLRRGIQLLLLGVAVLVAEWVAAHTIHIATTGPAGSNVGTLMDLLAYAAFFGGGWLLTAPDPSGLGEERYGRARRIVRVYVIVSGVDTLCEVALSTLVPDYGKRLMLLAFGGTALVCVRLAGQLAQLWYLSKLAERIPDAKLARWARFLIYAIGVSYGVLSALMPVFILVYPKPVAGPVMPTITQFILACIGFLALVASLVFGVGYLLHLFWLASHLKRQADFARQTWAAGPAMADR